MPMDSKRIEELKSAARDQLAIIEEGVMNPDIVKIEGKNITWSTDANDKIEEARKNLKQIKGLLTAEIFGKEMKDWLDAPASDSAAMAAGAAKFGGMGGAMPSVAVKDLGGAFIESEEFKSLNGGKNGYTMQTPFELDTFDVGSQGWGRKDIYTALGQHNVPMGIGTVVQFDPTVPRGRRVNRVRDLFPVATTSANLIDYFKVTGFVENGGDGNAAPVRERAGNDGVSAGNTTFGLKNKSNLTFTSDSAPVRTIAHWEAAHRNTLQDEPQLQSTINNELLYGLALEEDDQILNGDGNNENIRGVLATPGIQSYPAPTGELKSDSLRRAQTLGVLAYFPPTGYVVHPNDWEDVELQKATGGDEQYMLFTNVSVGMSAQIWRLPVVETPVMPEGTFLTGAFGTGAQLYDRARASVRIAEQHQDFFVRNAIAILVEERIALAVKRPESFVKGTFAA